MAKLDLRHSATNRKICGFKSHRRCHLRGDCYAINLTNVYYRVGVIDDFRSETSVIDCRKFGDKLLITDAWRVKGEHRGYQINEDSIGVFLNFKLVLETKHRAEAQKKLDKLIEECPPEFKKEFEEFREYLKI